MIIREATRAESFLADLPGALEESVFDTFQFLDAISNCVNVCTVLVEDNGNHDAPGIVDDLNGTFEKAVKMAALAIEERKSLFKISHWFEDEETSFTMYLVATSETKVSEFLHACLKDFQDSEDFDTVVGQFQSRKPD